MKWLKSIVCGGSLLLAYMNLEAHGNKVRKEEVYLHQLSESFHGRSIFFISDIHHRLVSKRLIDSIQNKTDLVIIGGDLLEQGVPLHKVRKNIQRLKRSGEVLFVWGNNDCESDKEGLEQILSEEDVHVIENGVYNWQINEDVLPITCLGDRNQKVNETSISTAEKIRILVSHDPSVIDKLDVPERFEVALTGHTHGGQIRFGPFGIREKGGWKWRRGIRLLISNGYGTTRLPLRLGAPPETHLLTLKRK